MRNKKHLLPLSLLRTFGVILFWFAIWEICGVIAYQRYHLSFILPTASQTLKRLFSLLPTADFWLTILSSVCRIGLGLICGMIFGVAIALLTHCSKTAKALISPLMTVIRATPVASFIMILWILMKNGSRTVPFAVALLMVLPVIWQSASDGFSSVDQNLSEVATIFSLSKKKRIKLLILPALFRQLLPAAVTSAGLAWKAGIAAEIIAYTANSIGSSIKNAKDALESADLFAWTLVVVILSLIFERGIRTLLARLERTKRKEKAE